jgi:hypothetical protein
MYSIRKIASALLLVCLVFSGSAHSSDYDKLTAQEKADLARYLGWVWGDGRPGYDGSGILYKGGNRNYNATVGRLARIRFDGKTNPFGFPVNGNLKLAYVWDYWENSLPGGNPGDPQVLRDAIRHPNFLAGILEGEGQIFHSDPFADFYVADQSYSPSHPYKLYDIANFGTERMIQLFRLLAETYGFNNPSISVGGKKYQYNTQFCQAIQHMRDEYDRRKAQNKRGDLVSGFTVKVYVNPPNFNQIRNYGYFDKFDGKFRTPAPDSRLRIIRSSMSDQNTEASGPMRFFNQGNHTDLCQPNGPGGGNGGGALADFEFSSSGSANNGRWQKFYFNVNAGERVEATVIWDDASADIRTYLRDETITQMDSNALGFGSASLSAVARRSGQWSVAVVVNRGSVNYDVLVDTTR